VIAGVPMVTGSPALLNAQVLGDAQHLDWDVNGDGKTDVSCPGEQPTLQFRPSPRAGVARAAADVRLSVRAVGADGPGPALSRSLTVAPATPGASQTLDNAVARFVSRQPPVYACGRAEDFGAAVGQVSGPAQKQDRCRNQTIIAGTLNVAGCLLPVRQLADVPLAERGIVQTLARTVGLGSSITPSSVLKNADRLLGKVDGAFSFGPVLVNGVELEPAGQASIVVYPQANQIVSSNASMTVGGITLANRTEFSLDTKPGRGNTIPLGDFARRPGPIAGLGAFPMVGDLAVTLLPAASPGAPAGAEISTELTLPSWLNVGGGQARARVKLRVTAAGALVLDDMHIALPDVWIGVLEIKELQLDFAREGADSVWRGQGKICVVEIACLDAVERSAQTPPGGVVIRNGELDRAFLNVEFPDPGIALYPNVYLNTIGAGVGLNPTRLFGHVVVKAIGIYEIDGKLVVAFPSAATPFRLTPGEIGGFTEEDYRHSYSRFTLAASGSASLRIPVLDKSFRLGGAYFVYEAPGYVHVGGDVEESFGGIITLRGRTSGQFNLANGKFNFGQDIEACVLDFFCRGSATRLSSAGVGACATFDAGIGSISIGGGVQFSPFDVLLWPLDGCKWSAFEDAGVFDGKAAAAQAAGSVTVTIKEGDPSRAIRLDGVDGAPRVRVTAPDGQVLDSPDGPGTALTPAIRIMRSLQLKTTIVGLQDPGPGTYRIDPLPLSPAITKVTEAADPPAARVTARVTGHGARRTLTYDVLARPKQRVTFVETGPGGGERAIVTVSRGRGRKTFTPAPGTGKRRIEAQFELNGIGAETKTVATFTAPSTRLGRPTHVTVRRRGDRLVVAWRRVAGAASYELVTTLASGEQRITSTRRPTATISPVTRSSGGRVTIRAVAPMRDGRATAARFAATAPREATRFGPLAKLEAAKGG
jgi:hypothetical protein